MDIQDKYSDNIIERGEGYLNSVKSCIKIKNFIYGKVEGSHTYKTEVDLDSLDGDCSCPYGTNCKHAVALYLTYKKGRYNDTEDFIKSINKMSNNELKELILSKLQENPDWIIKHNIRKNTNTKDFFKSFKKSFSSELINEADALLPDLSFQQLLELHDYIYKNYDELAEKLAEEDEDDYYKEDYWDDEEYDKELCELNEKLIEIIIKKSLKKDEVNEVIKRDSLREEIISQAESFKKYKNQIKKKFSKEEYLEFLLNLKNPNVSELMENITKSETDILFKYIEDKIKVIKNIANLLNDKTLIFAIAVYEKDFENILKNFYFFEEALKKDYKLIGKIRDIINIFILKKFRDENIAKKFIAFRKEANFDRIHIKYLAFQINDFDFISKEFNKENLEEDIILLERLAQINNRKTLSFINSKKELLKRHYSDVVVLFKFLKKVYDYNTIKTYIEKNYDSFRTSSHLKNHLKEIGVFISQREGKLIIDIK
ncbi:MAG: SWIM zinc finger family protein [Nanoarchaeota archaeon]